MSVYPMSWVRRRARGGGRGFVTNVEGHRALVRWTGSGKGTWHGKRALAQAKPPRLLVLEGSLDTDLHSTRSERDALANWAAANSAKLAFKTIHTVEDLAIIARSLGREEAPFVHISCHGDHDHKTGRPYLMFAPRHERRHRAYLDDTATIEAFRLFEGASVLVSACSIGRYGAKVTAFRRRARLKHVAAFSREVWDYEMLPFNYALYHAALNLGLTFRRAVERARQAMALLGVRGNRGTDLVRVF
jgi:hypothetical protein